MSLTGTFTALVTPFERSGAVDWGALEKLVKIQIENGIDGLVPCGTTGESPTLDHTEHQQVIARVTSWAKKINPDVTIIAGTGSNSTREAIELTKHAVGEGADYSLQVNPYYNKPSQEGLYEHFISVANASEIPLILYNIPGRTAVKLNFETIQRLSKHEKIAGIKEATGDLSLMTEIICGTKNFTLLSGDDNLLLPILAIGGRGIISVCSNVIPRQIARVTESYLAGETDQAREIFHAIFPLCQSMFYETNPVPVKYALSEMGLCENILRAPLIPLSEDHRRLIKKLLP